MVYQVNRWGIVVFYKPHTFPSEKGTALTLSPSNGGRLARFEPYQRCLSAWLLSQLSGLLHSGE